jgi:hypothetical protein
MEFTCEFCNSTFGRKTTLVNHQKTAKFCLELQGKENNNFVCQHCNKQLTTKNTLLVHLITCKGKLENNQEKLVEENIHLKEIINNKNDLIEKLQDKIQKLIDALIGFAESKHEFSNSDPIDKQINELTLKYGKKQRRQQIKEPNVMYILTTQNLKRERRYIFGKSKNLTSRLSTYNKTDDHEIIYYQPCGTEPNMDTVEKMVLNKLDKYREVENRDRFILPEDKEIDFFIDVIKKSIDFVLE